MRSLPFAALVAGLIAGLATPAAAAPAVVTDIAPVHALAARVMQGVGAPQLVTPPGASPHGYAMRPSDAAALAGAAVVFWVGEALTPWLEGAIDALAPDAMVVELAAVPGVTTLPLRQGATFAAHNHDDHNNHAHDDHAHDDHANDHAHDHGSEAAARVDEDHDHDLAKGAKPHDHGEHDDHHANIDPHLWLDPANAAAWVSAMAATLSQADPANAAAYEANAAAARNELEALATDVAATLTPVRGAPFIVFHDAYQYFEARFDMPAAGSVSISDATPPSAARVAEIRALARDTGAGCVFAEPQFAQGVVDAVAEGAGARVSVLDPLGAGLKPGPELYADLMRGLAGAMADCLAPRS